jgi:predicted component of type VI protein secretion system
MDFEVIIDLANLDSGLTSQSVFTRSPIWIGSDPANDLCLPGNDVSNRQGDIVFGGGGMLHYWDYDPGARTQVNGAPVPHGMPVPLGRPGVIAVGRYAFRARAQVPAVVSDQGALADRVRFLSVMDTRRPVASRRAVSNLTLARMEMIASRAVDLATTLANLLVKIRGHIAFPLPSTVFQLAGVSDIVDYLLDPAAGAEARLDEFARLVVAIVEWREFAGHASSLARA